MRLENFVAGVPVCIMPAVERPEQTTLRPNVFRVDFLEDVLVHCDPEESTALVLRFELEAVDIAAINNFFQAQQRFLRKLSKGPDATRKSERLAGTETSVLEVPNFEKFTTDGHTAGIA